MQKEHSNIFPHANPSLNQFLKEEQKRFPGSSQSLTKLLYTMAAVGKKVSKEAARANLLDIVGTQGTHNFSGDLQQKIDIIAQGHFIDGLRANGDVCAMLSEEQEGVIELAKGCHSNYIVALDPIDGSPNLGMDIPVGTIFSIYQRSSPAEEAIQQGDLLQQGNKQIAAGYFLYSTSTTFVYTAGHGVHKFTYELLTDKFYLTSSNIQMPRDGNCYAVNDGYFDSFPKYVQQYIQDCRNSGCSARYTGTLVADFHRHLLQGGIYMYPPTQKSPRGKLRLVLECNALAFIIKHAGGTASDGKQDILSINPASIHQRIPLYIGSVNMVEKLLSYNTCTDQDPNLQKD